MWPGPTYEQLPLPTRTTTSSSLLFQIFESILYHLCRHPTFAACFAASFSALAAALAAFFASLSAFFLAANSGSISSEPYTPHPRISASLYLLLVQIDPSDTYLRDVHGGQLFFHLRYVFRSHFEQIVFQSAQFMHFSCFMDAQVKEAMS